MYLNQGGLGLPDESYYREAKFKPIREKYRRPRREDVRARRNSPSPKSRGRAVMAVETELASTTGTASRAATARSPTTRWTARHSSRCHRASTGTPGSRATATPAIDEVIVRQPDYFTAISRHARAGSARRLEDLAEVAPAARARLLT